VQTKTKKRLYNVLIGAQVLVIASLTAFSVTYHEPTQHDQSNAISNSRVPKKKVTPASSKVITNHKQFIESESNKLMTLLWNWDDSNSYNANKVASAKLVGQANASKLFAVDKDVSGNSFINTAQLSSQLVSSSIWVADLDEYDKSIIHVDITAVYHAQFGADNYTSWSGDGVPDTAYYHATYNMHKRRFTSVEFVGRLDQNV
jgi:hypothetical protein